MDWNTHLSYLGVLIAILLAGFGLPVPEDIPLLTAGYLCHLGSASLYVMIPMTLVAVTAADVMLYALGRRFGNHAFDHRITRMIFRRTTVAAIEKKYRKHGAKIIFAGRFMPGARGMIFTCAGAVGIPFWKFVVVDGTAILLSVPTVVLIGKFFGAKARQMFADVRHIEHYIAAVIAVALIIGVSYEWYRNYHIPKGEKHAAEREPTDQEPVEPDPEPELQSRPKSTTESVSR
jgi:membrane protein DedA with SNARE-associated domain